MNRLWVLVAALALWAPRAAHAGPGWSEVPVPLQHWLLAPEAVPSREQLVAACAGRDPIELLRDVAADASAPGPARERAVSLLSFFGDDPRALDALEAIASTNAAPAVRAAATYTAARGWARRAPARVRAVLIAALDDPDSAVRRAAAAGAASLLRRAAPAQANGRAAPGAALAGLRQRLEQAVSADADAGVRALARRALRSARAEGRR